MEKTNGAAEDELRQAACIGDAFAVKELLSSGVNVNARHSINGWTPLHWACKRGHGDIVSLLLKNGAERYARSEKGETPISVCTDRKILQLLDVGTDVPPRQREAESPAFVPNYLRNPPLNASVATGFPMEINGLHGAMGNDSDRDELVLKVRLADSADPDFIEVELPKQDLTIHALLRTCCAELRIPHIDDVVRVRKLPNTKLRKDKDVRRLTNFQEIEIITDADYLVKLAKGSANVQGHFGAPTNGYQSISKKDQMILY